MLGHGSMRTNKHIRSLEPAGSTQPRRSAITERSAGSTFEEGLQMACRLQGTQWLPVQAAHKLMLATAASAVYARRLTQRQDKVRTSSAATLKHRPKLDTQRHLALSGLGALRDSTSGFATPACGSAYVRMRGCSCACVVRHDPAATTRISR